MPTWHSVAVGTWGTGIFADDVAADVRDCYRDLLGDGVADADAMRQIIAEFTEPDEITPTVVWLALAAAQREVGRLDEDVRDRALQIIADGSELDRWAEEPRTVQARRRAVLSKLADQLTGEQPPRRRVRRQWKPTTDLEPGDVLATVLPDGTVQLLRAVLIERTPNGSCPLLELLDHRGASVPSLDQVATHVRGDDDAVPRRWVVTPQGPREPYWREGGFQYVGRLQPRPHDERASTDERWTSWPALRGDLSAMP